MSFHFRERLLFKAIDRETEGERGIWCTRYGNPFEINSCRYVTLAKEVL